MTMKKLETIRAEIRELQQQIHATQNAAMTDEQIAERVSRWLDSQQAYLDEKILDRSYGLTQPATGAGLWPDIHDAVLYDGARVAFALSATANRKWLESVLIDRACQKARELGQVDDRDKATFELRKRLYELEVKEEAIVTAMEESGETVYRRGDANPAAVLNLGMA